MSDLCIHCSCPATVEIVTGEWLCGYHFEQVPRNEAAPCPNCSSQVESALPSRDSLTTPAPHLPGGAGEIVPAQVPPLPEPGLWARESFLDLQHALRQCVQVAEDDGVEGETVSLALHALSMFHLSVMAATLYRRQAHNECEDPDYYQLWVPRQVADMAFDLMRGVKL